MALINVPKSFNKQTISDKKTTETLGPFIDYINQNFDQFGRALAQQLTFAENFKGEIATIQAKHNQSVTINPKSPVAYAFPLSTLGDSVRSFSFTALADGGLALNFMFQNSIPLKAKTQTASSGAFATYQVLNPGGVAVGDRVTITGFGNKSNNVSGGLVLWVDSDSSGPIVTVYNGSGVAAEDLGEFRGNSESFKEVKVLLLYA